MRKGWKVIDEDRASPTRSWADAGHTVYPAGKLVEPALHCGPLAVFRRKEAAIHFAERVVGSGAQVVPCKYTPSQDVFLHDASSFSSRLHLNDTPDGTVFASSVRCLE